jgi:hypothetical protein
LKTTRHYCWQYEIGTPHRLDQSAVRRVIFAWMARDVSDKFVEDFIDRLDP